MYVSAKVDYAIRALLVLAAGGGKPVSAASIAKTEQVSLHYVSTALGQMRRAGILISSHTGDAGYRLARPAAAITLAEVFRALGESLMEINGMRPEDARYEGLAMHLQEVWIALRASQRSVLEQTTIEDVARGTLPEEVRRLAAGPQAWEPY